MLKVQRVGDIVKAMEAEHQAGRRAVAAGVKAAGEGLKRDWRAQIASAGLGRRLGNAIRAKHYPGRPSLGAASLVYAQPKSAPDILASFEEGLTIRGKNGNWLAIPTDAAPRARNGSRITPLEFERRTGQRLQYVYRRGKSALLVAEGRVTRRGRYAVSRSNSGRGRTSVVMFVLVPQVTIRKRIGLIAAAIKRGDQLPMEILVEWSQGGYL